jgi:hypothetical protein
MLRFLSAVALALPLSASVIVDSSTGSLTPNLGVIFTGPSTTIADVFTLSAPPMTSVTIRSASVYFAEAPHLNLAGGIQYFILLPNSIFPGSILAEGIVGSYQESVIYPGTEGFRVRRFDFNLIAPVNLTAGSYYFAWRFGAAGGGSPLMKIGGLTFSTSASNLSAASWQPTSGTIPYQLRSSVIPAPEPSPLLLAAPILLALLHGRKNQ